MSAYLRKQQARWAKGDVRAPSARNAARRFYRRTVRPVGREALVAARRAIPGQRMLPSFLIIGAHRAGTTSLYSYLLQHRQVLPALAKEIGYFDLHYETRPFDWYRAHFPPARHGSHLKVPAMTGEASPNYMYHPAVPERVQSRLPDIKLIVLLRDPVARAYSHYHYAINSGFERLSLEDAIRAEPERLRAAERSESIDGSHLMSLRRLAYVDRGMYHWHLARWLERFPRDRLLAIETERLYEDLSGTMGEVFEFLDLESFDIGRPARMNVLQYPRVPPIVEEQLRELFRPHNQKLSELLGQTFRWAV